MHQICNALEESMQVHLATRSSNVTNVQESGFILLLAFMLPAVARGGAGVADGDN